MAGYDAESLGTRPRTGSAFRERRYLLDSRNRKRVWNGKIGHGEIFETARSLRRQQPLPSGDDRGGVTRRDRSLKY
jgi:hypothetical protein